MSSEVTKSGEIVAQSILAFIQLDKELPYELHIEGSNGKSIVILSKWDIYLEKPIKCLRIYTDYNIWKGADMVLSSQNIRYTGRSPSSSQISTCRD